MYVSTDVLLAIALPSLYLLDCVLLLHADEVVLKTRAGRIHEIAFGSDFLLARRRPAMINPFLPFRLAFKAQWDLSVPKHVDASAADTVRLASEALRPVRALSTVALYLSVVAAPSALLINFDTLFAGCWIACLLLTATNGVLAWLKRKALAIPALVIVRETAMALVFLPYAGSLARHLALLEPARVQLPAFALTQLGKEEAARFRNAFATRLQGLRLGADEQSQGTRRIDDLLAELREQSR